LSDGGYLLDSHVLLWFDGEPQRLSEAVHQILHARSSVFVSAATAWELGIKLASNKLKLPVPISNMTQAYGFSELQISFQHAEVSAAFPLHHRDPFDRLLLAQARVEGLVLVTSDSKLSQYGVPVLLV
jgi:PIN domain nuclease of toxin-antitoxin system